MTIFKNRTEAGKKLAELLSEFKGTDAVVLALPRGGVIVGQEIARALNLPLDIIVTRKIGAPGNDEYAIGAIDINGNGSWNEAERSYVDKKWLAEKIVSEKKEAERRWNAYRKGRDPLDLKNKTIIIGAKRTRDESCCSSPRCVHGVCTRPEGHGRSICPKNSYFLQRCRTMV